MNFPKLSWRSLFLFGDRIVGMQKNVAILRIILGEHRRTAKRDIAAFAARDIGNLIVFGRNHDAIERTRARGTNHVGDQRPTVERQQILPGQPLRTAAGKDHAESTHIISLS